MRASVVANAASSAERACAANNGGHEADGTTATTTPMVSRRAGSTTIPAVGCDGSVDGDRYRTGDQQGAAPGTTTTGNGASRSTCAAGPSQQRQQEIVPIGHAAYTRAPATSHDVPSATTDPRAYLPCSRALSWRRG